MQPVLKVFIGFDPRAHVAFHALANSILSRASVPVSITPLILPTLPISKTGLTQFTYTRFLVPYLTGFAQEPAIFMDSDIICLGDVAELVSYVHNDPTKAVWATKFQTGPEATVQHLNAFERAAVMVFNCGHTDNQKLTPEFIETTDIGLHGLKWTTFIGDLPEEWQHVVMYQAAKQAKLIHYTAGIPIWPETHHLGFAKEFEEEIGRAVSAVSYWDLMSRSVHHQHVMRIFQEIQKQKNADALAKAAMEQGSVSNVRSDDERLQPAVHGSSGGQSPGPAAAE